MKGASRAHHKWGSMSFLFKVFRPLTSTPIQKFKASLHGELIRPEDADYDTARKVWNGMINKHPALIARCFEVADVIKAVNFARANGPLVAVRGGGHNVSG